MDTVLCWVNKCLNDHPECRDTRQANYLKPTRLLYLDPDQTDILMLIPVTKLKEYHYVTLSHRWGSPAPPKLSKLNNDPDQRNEIFVGTLEKGMRITELPRIFQDAIRIVRRCGLRYLWIDSLCIFQDKDPENRNLDWAKEADKMADIYAGGVFNIAATCCPNSEAGLIPAKRDILLPIVPDMAGRGTARILWENPFDRFEEEIISSELLSRGWVYQEVLLMPANLFCTAEEMWWSCSHTTGPETFPRGAVRKSILSTPSTEAILIKPFRELFTERRKALMAHQALNAIDAWMKILQYYPATSVTFSSDRLVAIAGIANLIKAQYPTQLKNAIYHSGIWFSPKDPFSLNQLLWSRRPEDKIALHTYAVSNPNLIPSWSPVNINGRVEFVGTDLAKDELCIWLPEFVSVGGGYGDNLDKSGLLSDNVGTFYIYAGCWSMWTSIAWLIMTDVSYGMALNKPLQPQYILHTPL